MDVLLEACRGVIAPCGVGRRGRGGAGGGVLFGHCELEGGSAVCVRAVDLVDGGGERKVGLKVEWDGCVVVRYLIRSQGGASQCLAEARIAVAPAHGPLGC